ncbi:hypothetical protein QTO34_000850 [Cnephaeus nilssonii]|uniref:Uncharacterized protein n=1 Tax=Cnephaeus nilssonii TaxID=3371016 RepID=A0AA40ICE1_CNENI|nr:hypothetical protein QTO34_000850 [Eptesicus nilssonii]
MKPNTSSTSTWAKCPFFCSNLVKSMNCTTHPDQVPTPSFSGKSSPSTPSPLQTGGSPKTSSIQITASLLKLHPAQETSTPFPRETLPPTPDKP